jgi:hypothetical protein
MSKMPRKTGRGIELIARPDHVPAMDEPPAAV